MTIRVAHVIDQLTPAGAQRVLLANIRALDPLRVESTVYAIFRPDEMSEDFRAAGARTICLGASGATDLPLAALRLWRRLRQRPADVVHTQIFPADICGRIAGWLAGVPVITTFQNPVNESTRHLGTVGLLQNWLQWATYRVAGANAIAVSDAVRASVRRSLGSDATVIRNAAAVDLTHWGPIGPMERSAARARLELPDEAFVFGNVARLDPQKAQDRLLEAAATLVREGLPLYLLLVGDGPSRAGLRSLAADLGIADRLRWTGWVPNARVPAAACDAFVLSSIFEGDSLTLLEGLAVGLPFVATRVGSAPEMLTDGTHALLVLPDDVPALADAMRRVTVSADLRRSLGKAGRERALAVCDHEVGVRALERVYSSLAARSPSSS